MYKKLQDWLTIVSHRIEWGSTQRVSIHWRLKGPRSAVHGNVPCKFVSEAHGSVMEGWRAFDEAWRLCSEGLKSPRWNPNSLLEARSWHLSWTRRLELLWRTCYTPSWIHFYCNQPTHPKAGVALILSLYNHLAQARDIYKRRILIPCWVT